MEKLYDKKEIGAIVDAIKIDLRQGLAQGYTIYKVQETQYVVDLNGIEYDCVVAINRDLSLSWFAYLQENTLHAKSFCALVEQIKEYYE